MSNKLSKRLEALTGLATKKAAAALNRADEVGGEVRDWLVERVGESERAQKVLAQVKKLRRSHDKDVAAETRERMRAARAAKLAADAEAAPPPTKAEVAAAEVTGLANPNLPAQIYGRSSCPWTGRAITLLEKKKVDYDFIDLDDEDNGPLDTQLVADTSQNTVPYIYLRGEFIGGFNALDELERLGQLDERLLPVEQRKPSNVVVVARDNSDERHPGEVEDGPR